MNQKIRINACQKFPNCECGKNVSKIGLTCLTCYRVRYVTSERLLKNTWCIWGYFYITTKFMGHEHYSKAVINLHIIWKVSYICQLLVRHQAVIAWYYHSQRKHGLFQRIFIEILNHSTVIKQIQTLCWNLPGESLYHEITRDHYHWDVYAGPDNKDHRVDID